MYYRNRNDYKNKMDRTFTQNTKGEINKNNI